MGHFALFDCWSPFCSLLIEFHCTFFISYEIFHIMFIITAFRLASKILVCCLFYSLPRDQSRDVTPRLEEGGWFFIFDCWSPFCFLLIVFFPSLIYCWHVMFIIAFHLVLTRSSLLFLRRISTVLSQGISHGMWLLAWEFLLFTSVLSFEYASSFRLLLLRLYSNGCAKALFV